MPLHLFRMIMPLFLLIHGVYRIYNNGVAPFGEYLDSKGFPGGIYWAWAVTLLDIVGSICIIAGVLVRIFCALFIIELICGMIMVHSLSGWFVVGGGNNGMEFSALLILCLLLIALTWKEKRKQSL